MFYLVLVITATKLFWMIVKAGVFSGVPSSDISRYFVEYLRVIDLWQRALAWNSESLLSTTPSNSSFFQIYLLDAKMDDFQSAEEVYFIRIRLLEYAFTQITPFYEGAWGRSYIFRHFCLPTSMT